MLQHKQGQEFCFGPQALKEALISTNAHLKDLYASTFSTAEKCFLSEAYNPNRIVFQTLLIRTAFDWLISRPEAPEDFESFYNSARWRQCTTYKRTIYIQPIAGGQYATTEGSGSSPNTVVHCPGDNSSSDLLPSGTDMYEREGEWMVIFLDNLKSYLGAFFLGLNVKFLPSISSLSIKCDIRRIPHSSTIQLHVDGILKHLMALKPMDAFCVLGVTFCDLYSCDTWNYTYGKSLNEQVGVCSFSRLSGRTSEKVPEAGEWKAETHHLRKESQHVKEQPETLTLNELLQCCKVVSHEVRHLVGLEHCRWLRCAMQGVTSQDEVFLRPTDLCPICLRKLQFALGFTLLERYKKLQAWCQHASFTWIPKDNVDRITLEDPFLFSSDSGISCENVSEPLSATLETVSPNAENQEVSVARALEHDGHPTAAALFSFSGTCKTQRSEETVVCVELFADPLQDYEAWLDLCITNLETEVPEDKLSQLDNLVDALPPHSTILDRVPIVRVSLEAPKEDRRLKTIIGQKFSLLCRKLSSRKLKMSHLFDDSGED
nr:PREDICTED: archaemetzincin-1 isoform X3 [Lepisosteus oculatus]